MSQPLTAARPPVPRECTGTSLGTGKTYLYAIVAAELDQPHDSPGIDDADVHTITAGRVSAVVSCVSHARLRPERRHIAAHQRVLKRLMAETTPLPMAFGMTAESPDAVRGILARNQGALLGALRRVSGNVEMGLRATWDVPNIFEHFVSTHAELRILRDRLFAAGREPAREERIELGRLFERLLQAERDAHAGKAEAVLAQHCVEIERGNCRPEQEAFRLACLVPKLQQEAFEGCVFRLAQLFDNSFAFDFNGPWPPYNFAKVELDM
ncbi:MAG: GvpL/GvpF family gas vesicle protein [Acidobacteria bacterium]|nr:GvpL/GvpF family gas vesicle protein [Acidobacteriota bacterium]